MTFTVSPLFDADPSEFYDVPVETKQKDKATRLKLSSFKRPHMRAFHFAWFGFFTAVGSWFAFAPLMNEVQANIGFSADE